MEEKRFYKITEAAAYLGISRSVLYRHVQARRIDSLRIGQSIRFTRAQLDAFVRDVPREDGLFNQ